jgi:hypothetical protein
MSRRARTYALARPWADLDAFHEPDDQDGDELDDLGPWPMPPAPDQQQYEVEHGTAS